MLNKKALAGTAGAPKEYVEDVFSTYLYTGTGSNQTITNNIDISGKGGLVWIKGRSPTSSNNTLYDTERGAGVRLRSNLTNAQSTNLSGYDLTSFTSSGFTLGTAQDTGVNSNGDTSVSWTFRKAKKFFDIVTWTGTGSTGAISRNHNLGSTPGCIIVKAVSTTEGQWYVYHRSLGVDKVISLNLTNAADSAGSPDAWAVTSTTFSINTSQIGMNTNGTTYIAYLFAHDAGGFGDAGSDSIISCGSYTGNASTGGAGPVINLGWEPQWILLKRAIGGTDNWRVYDVMRGLSHTTNALLYPNATSTEAADNPVVVPNATGFSVNSTGSGINQSGDTIIYIAIRRGPMKTPTTGTSVFSPIARTATSANATVTAGFVPDLVMNMYRNVSGSFEYQFDRLRGPLQYLATGSTASEGTGTASLTAFNNTTYNLGTDSSGLINLSPYTTVNWVFGRAPGFFDVVCYTGTGSQRTVSHNLGVAPELIIVKSRNDANDWAVYSSAIGNTKNLRLNTTAAESSALDLWASTTPSATTFTVTGTFNIVNGSTVTYVAYLFASVSGVSKVGSYTGNGSNQTINCGFTNGARFILIKRTDNTGDWYVWDSARGIVAANDPYLLLNSTAAEVTTNDSVDPDNSGFIVNQNTTTNINVNAATYIYLAIA